MIDSALLSKELMKAADLERDKNRVINVLSQAFEDDPVFDWMVKQDGRRQQRIRKLLNVSVKLTAPFDEVYLAKNGNGAAVWVPPDKHKLSALQNLTVLTMFLQISGFRRILEMIRFFSFLESQQPKEAFFHLLYLGVVPKDQGRGIGSALLEPILDYCSQNKLYAYLENSNERNLPLYERHGFKTFYEWVISKNGPTIWFMKRSPRG